MLTVTELEKLGRQHLPEFRALALRLTKDRDLASDLVQDALYLILKYRAKFKPGSNFSAWVKTIIRNVFISEYRLKKRRRDLLQDNQQKSDWANYRTVNNTAESNLGAEEIMRLVNELSENYRRAFLLFYQGRRYKEIASLTGVPIGTAKSRVFTARKTLKAQLIQRGFNDHLPFPNAH